MNTHCANCSTPLAGRYCTQCGQDAHLQRRPLGELAQHAFDELTGLDNRIFRTLNMLIVQPGELTREYIFGRRQPYVPALRLYFAIAVSFFVLLSLTGIAVIQLVPYQPGIDPPGSYVSVSNSAGTVGARVLWLRPLQRVQISEQQKAAIGKMQKNLESQGDVTSALIGDRVMRLLIHAYADSTSFNAGVQMWVSRFLLLMMPVFAVMTAVLRPGRYLFVDHLTFALHLHTLVFIILAVVACLSFLVPPGWLSYPTLLLLGLYLLLSLKRAYELTFVAALWRTVVMLVAYVAAFVYGLEFTILLTMSA